MKKFDELLRLIEKLRSKEGCHWDKEQTINSMRENILKEANEVVEAVDNDDMDNLREELGDVLWDTTMIIQIAKEKGLFDMDDVLKKLNEKIVRRHPHVFGKVKAKDAEEAMKFFQEAKAKEKNNKKEMEKDLG